MSDGDLLLAIDQGTSSTRAIVYDMDLAPVARADRPVHTSSPRPGWYEQSPREIRDSVVESVAEVLTQVRGSARIVGAGLANQGETVVAWHADTGAPLAEAVSWQCRRSEPVVEALAAAGHEAEIRRLTGLPLGAHFSAGKLAWLLDNEPSVRAAASVGRLRVGTVDAWLSACLSGAALTDPSTASRTQLFGLDSLAWEPRLLALFGVAQDTLPTLRHSAGSLATLRDPAWPVEIELTAAVCDQQAALAGHAGFSNGAVKATYGTGVFVVANAGSTPPSTTGLEVSVGWQLPDAEPAYVLQGGVLSASSLLHWMHEDLGLPIDPVAAGALAEGVPDSNGVTVLPSLSGLGAPHYRGHARAVIAGLTGGATASHVARAALDGIAHRVCDIVDALERAVGTRPVSLRVDGGMTSLRYLMQRQADLLGLPVDVSADHEATARGAALLAGVGAGVLSSASQRPPTVEQTFRPSIAEARRMDERRAWDAFVARAAEL